MKSENKSQVHHQRSWHVGVEVGCLSGTCWELLSLVRLPFKDNVSAYFSATVLRQITFFCISVLLTWSTVGNMVFWGRIVFEEELKNNIFTNSPIGATMQDGGKRERSSLIVLCTMHHYLVMLISFSFSIFSFCFLFLFLNYHKLHSVCISTISGLIFTNWVVLESPKWGLSAHMWDVQKQQQTTKSDHQ